MEFANDFEELLEAFNNDKVDFILAGGFAVNFHGYNRSTSDLDIWVKPIESNKIKIKSALKKSNFPNEALSQIDTLDFSRPFTFSVGIKPLSVDIFNHITGVSYAEAEKTMIPFKYSDSLTVNYISLKDLILNKMLTGRPKDKLDITELQKIEKLRQKS
jgi:hypothetical protein